MKHRSQTCSIFPASRFIRPSLPEGIEISCVKRFDAYMRMYEAQSSTALQHRLYKTSRSCLCIPKGNGGKEISASRSVTKSFMLCLACLHARTDTCHLSQKSTAVKNSHAECYPPPYTTPWNKLSLLLPVHVYACDNYIKKKAGSDLGSEELDKKSDNGKLGQH